MIRVDKAWSRPIRSCISISAMASVMLLLNSCNHKDLIYEYTRTSKLYVEYDWREAPSATPDGMCVYFYSEEDSTNNRRFDFPGMKGGEIEMPAGHYKLITYNNDTEVVQFSAISSFDAHKAYTRTGDLLEPLYGNGVTSTAKPDNNERVVITPDSLWGSSVTDVLVTEHGTVTYYSPIFESRAGEYDDNGDQVITLYPRDMLCHYSYEVRNVKNVEHISRVSSSLSGMAGAMNLSTGNLDTECVTLPLPGRTDIASNRILGEFLTFGHNEANTAPHKMEFYMVMDDGSKYIFKGTDKLDVTSQVDTASNRQYVHIIIDGLDVPTPRGGSEGFSTTVDDWETSEQDFHI